ncbi:fungal-specific transcription factor domain-containing protein [Sphaerosporella brunnea]|uniref:Fungal-specific transcription factor domain-containing protein n=1 Tax=Sphaerosporella brunnea TaxID=1250544 RepID=A0A5J5EUT1_9PEZI|nr:fungal-specific transcription factor domain-containing protein [Sphaerosporella brunnea]
MVDTTAPLLRVSRPVSACSRCRSAKVKCDGKLPACTACERAGRSNECTGGSDQFARGKERSYVASLESKLEKLEKRLAALDAASRRPPAAVAEEEEEEEEEEQKPAVTSNANAAHSPRTLRRKKQEDDGEMEDLVADLGYMAINAVTRDFYGFADDISFGRIALRASSVSSILNSKPRARLPPRHTATRLVQHYFDKIFTTLPCLNESSFFGAVDSVYRDESSASPFDSFCVYMVLAVGTMSLSKSQDSPAAHQAACFVKAALEHVDTVISPSEIKGVQATLLLVQYSMLEPSHFNSWYLIGVASRIMIDIGLHQEPLKVSKRKATEMDLRRRVFYCVYTLDRSISMVLQRPFTFSDDSVLVSLPRVTEAPLRNTLTPMTAATHLFKLRKLQSEWYQSLHLSGSDPLPNPSAYIRHHTALLHEWKHTLPHPSLSPSTHNWLLLEWHYLNIYIAAPSPKIPRSSQEGMQQIYTHSSSYAFAFRSILSDSPTSGFVYTYHDALRTYFVGSNLLHALFHMGQAVLEQAMDAIDGIVFILDSMIIRWPDAEALRDKFRAEAAFVVGRLEEVAPPRVAPTTAPWHIPQHQQPGGHVATADFGNVAFYRYV